MRDISGKQHDANGDADDAQRQLIDPVGVIEIGDGAIDGGRDHGRNQDVHLGDAARDDAWYAEADQSFGVGCELRQLEPQAHIGAAAGDIKQDELRDARNTHAPDQGITGQLAVPPAHETHVEQGHDHDHIEQDGRAGCGDEAA